MDELKTMLDDDSVLREIDEEIEKLKSGGLK